MTEHIDKHGFLSDRRTHEVPLTPFQVNARIEKWHHMLSNWDEFSTSKYKILKRRCRKGIPSLIRSRAWFMLCKGIQVKNSYPGHLYFRLCNRDEDPPCMLDITKDVNRTFPEHVLFRGQNGQVSLTNVLRAYAYLDTEIGYCQGMGYIVGVFLMHMDEESAFWMLVSFMHNYQMRGYYVQGMGKLYQSLYKANHLFKSNEYSLWKKFTEFEFYPQIYATQWFLTLFTFSFPIEAVLRIWDCFLLEGPKIMFRVFLGFFKTYKLELKDLDFDDLLMTIRRLESTIDTELLLKAAFSLNLSRTKLSEIDREYEHNPNPQLINWAV